MLLNGRQLLEVAARDNFAVPAFNISDYSMMNAVFDACEEADAPFILAIHPDEMSHLRRSAMPAFIDRAHRSSVPTAIHWDHGASYEQALMAIQYGFTSVMIDASLLAFEENIALSTQVAEAAHAVGVSVEAELGTIGKGDSYGEAGADDIIYTNPADAVQFVERTGVDSLAVAIGTRHGLYPESLTPELRLDLLDEIDAAVSVPLVLHGGSNNPDREIADACRRGINKVNISSDIKVAYFSAMREVLSDPSMREPNAIQPACQQALTAVAIHKIELFGAAGRASSY
ncbi:ketose-bisphosphate aldolase [Bogoriella caseilytica]|uniref:Fructose-bisphosphate aldolase class II n=1 Tax=Bogoriella caseilytica TaxID=56055 RepID=A0A3N2BD23_9MICO|nr:ketose-bisphosphate aldolase [Bogoriella caseilytica]ROR73151.1 fructose-bisphosphate aldolase class II [Bogoriella caseilytica]